MSRTNYISSHVDRKLRIVGLSTALANARDLGEWLGITNVGLFNFRPSVRPVPLEVHIAGVFLSRACRDEFFFLQLCFLSACHDEFLFFLQLCFSRACHDDFFFLQLCFSRTYHDEFFFFNCVIELIKK